ncbi:heterokaryon incompatibility protein-domain-containing protein [Bisporella sp. PMI_857]|nr:heterokaryon incompatibility protein-domain-containing protein [Bisporella sp. PMI_857]
MFTVLSSSSLCAVCKKVDINNLLPICEQVKQPSNPGSYRRWPDGRMERFNPREAWIPEGEGNHIFLRVDYGTIGEVIGRRDACRMCDFVLKILDRGRGSDFPSTSHIHLSFDTMGKALENWKWQPAFRMRLINVKDVCLETFDTNRRPPRYVTLSYVWGKALKSHVLKKENLASYHKARSLKVVPKTIRDAMLAARALGERFLWVDALCIVQDDASDKRAQIPAMGAIYSSAILTIIAASGGDSNAGLSGISSLRPSPSSVSLGKWTLLESCSPSLAIRNDPHIGTVWSTRGWTFQEFLLSHRTLTFLKSQVVWRCHGAEYFEEFDIDGLTFEGVFDRPMGPALQGTTSSTWIGLASYPFMVNEYLSRELTFDEDIHNAFSGVLQLYDDMTFFWGIPEGHNSFAKCLAWNLLSPRSAVPQQRRKVSFHIPSWSWMAWKEMTSLPYPYDNFCDNSYYRLKNDSLEPIEHWRKPVTMADIPLGLALQPHYLIFRAPLRKLRVGDVREKVGQDCTIQEQNLIRGYASICKGKFWLEISWNGGVATRHNAVSVALMEDLWSEIPWMEELIILG